MAILKKLKYLLEKLDYFSARRKLIRKLRQGKPVTIYERKLRVAIPPEFRRKFWSDYKVIINRGLNGCLCLYNTQEWQVKRRNLGKIIADEKEEIPFRLFAKILRTGKEKTKMNDCYEVIIPYHLAEHAGINEDVVFSNDDFGNLEIWAKEKFDAISRKGVESTTEVVPIMENLALERLSERRR